MYGSKRALIDSVIIDEMKKKLAMMAYETDAFGNVYREALKDFWVAQFEQYFGERFNNKIQRVVARVRFSDGVAEVQIIDIWIGYEFDVNVVVHQRIKSGRWGKTKYYYNAEFIINNILSVEN